MVKDKDKEAEGLTRSFEMDVNGESKKYYLETPSAEQIRKSEWHYSKIYNKALLEGVATESEMVDILTKRGIYGPEYEKHLDDLRVKVAVRIAEAQNETDSETKRKLAREAEELRDELFRWNQRITGPLSNTCERMAEDAKMEYLTSVFVKDEKGNLVWDSYDDFLAEENQALSMMARYQVLLLLQGLDEDFLEQTPEKKILRELALEEAELKAQEAEKKETPKLKSAEADSVEDKPKKKTTKTRRKRTSAKKQNA